MKLSPPQPPGMHWRGGVCIDLNNMQFHTGDINQCLPLITHVRVGASHVGVPNVNFLEFMFLLVYYGNVLSLFRE